MAASPHEERFSPKLTDSGRNPFQLKSMVTKQHDNTCEFIRLPSAGSSLMSWFQSKNSTVNRRCPSCIIGKLTRNQSGVWVCGNEDPYGDGECCGKVPCKFVIEDSIAGLQRISIGAIGKACAGKTHWCTELIQSLQQSPAWACSKLMTPKREDSVFLDSIVSLERGYLSPTYWGLLHTETIRGTSDALQRKKRNGRECVSAGF